MGERAPICLGSFLSHEVTIHAFKEQGLNGIGGYSWVCSGWWWECMRASGEARIAPTIIRIVQRFVVTESLATAMIWS